MSDTVLITGGSGFIGTHICKALVKAGNKVINFDMFSRRSPLAWLLGDIEKEIIFEKGSADDFAALVEVVNKHKVNKIAHLAASIDIDTLVKNPRLAYQDMLGATINILEVCRLYNMERLVNFSSIGVLPTKQYEPIDVKHPLFLAGEGPCSAAYGAGKISGEAFCWAYKEAYNLDFITLRPSAAYGFLSGNVIYLNQFLEAALRGEPCHFPDGKDYPRDYTHVDDIAGLAVAALNLSSEKIKDRVFYAASGISPLVTAGETAQIVREMVPSADISIAEGLNYIDSLEIKMRGVLDVRPVEEQLGYQIKYRDVRKGMIEHADRYCEWLIAQGKKPADRKI